MIQCCCAQVVPTGPQQPANTVSTYLSLCLGVSMSFCAALTLMMLWRWAQHTDTQTPAPTGRFVAPYVSDVAIMRSGQFH